MPKIQVVSAIPHSFSNGWRVSDKFNCKNREVDNKGRSIAGLALQNTYKVEQKVQRKYSWFRRGVRASLGVVAVITTLFIALFFKPVRKLFTEKYEKIRYATAVPHTPSGVPLNSSGTLHNTKTLPLEVAQLNKSYDEEQVDRELNSKNNLGDIEIRGTKWGSNVDIDRYVEYLKERHSVHCYHSNLILGGPSYMITLKGIANGINATADSKDRNSWKQFLISLVSNKERYHCMNLCHGRHSHLILIDKEARTVEFYNSFVTWSDHKEVTELLSKVTEGLSKHLPNTKWFPGDKKFEFKCKIQKKLQQDSYQCVFWSLFFLENRMLNSSVDFNQMNIKKAQSEIADFRLHVQKTFVHRKTLGILNQWK